MDVHVIERKRAQDGCVLAEYVFSDMPIILSTILGSELPGKVYREGNIIPEDYIDKAAVDRWHDVFLSLAGHQGLSRVRTEYVARESKYALSVFATQSASVICSPHEMQLFVCKVNAFLLSSCQFETRMPADFLKKLCNVLKDFMGLMQPLIPNKDVAPSQKGNLSLFAWRERRDEWGENYCSTFPASFGLLDYCSIINPSICEFSFIKEPNSEVFASRFHIPEIINGTKFADAWNEDLNTLVQKGYYPAAMLVNICERGTLDSFTSRYKAIQERVAWCPEKFIFADEVEDQLVINMWARYSNNVYIHSDEKGPNGISLSDVDDELSNLL